MASILIKNGRLWDGERFFFADILTDGDRIARIEPNITEEAKYVYDAMGKTVSAGLVDTHVHMRGISSEKYGIQTEMACFPFGVTAAADAGGRYGDLALLDCFAVKSLVFVEVSIKENHADFTSITEKIAKYGNRAVGVKVYFDTVVSGVTDLSPLRAVCEFAHQRGLRVMVHCSNPPVSMAELLECLAEGDLLTHAFHGGNNNASEDNFESMKQAQARGVIIDTGFAAYVHTDFAVFQGGIRAGMIPNTVSTDITKSSAYIRGGRYGLTMCMSMARHMGMGEEEIFRAVTSNAARALGKETEWGYLQVGRRADIAVLDDTDEGFSLTDKAGNFIESNRGYRCVLTVSDGQILYKY